MDVLKTLSEKGHELYSEDLDFFEAELATGEYEAAYADQCRKIIAEIRNWNKAEPKAPVKAKNSLPTALLVSPGELSPGSKKASTDAEILAEVSSLLEKMRNMSDYKSAFKKYVLSSPSFTEEFVERNFAMFLPWEKGALLSEMPFSEDFLERYISVLDMEKVARYQLFSEKFFMKHFARFDAALVLEKGKNEWRKKQSRSSQLDVFLRLKGVKL